jgi:DNA uptake protein ComE-like DNA-binding protein
MIRVVKEFLTYSKSERMGISVLLVILMGLIVVRYFIPLQRAGEPLEDRVFDDEAEAFLQQLVFEKEKAPQKHHSNGSRVQQYVNLYDTLLLDLNTADTLDLQLLRGIGPWFAGNIVKYREALGGYINKEQLLEVYGMDSSRYAYVAKNVYADTMNIRKIDINSSSLKEMLRHPYLEYHVVKAILVYRAEAGTINDPEELLNLDPIYEEMFGRISPYLEAR